MSWYAPVDLLISKKDHPCYYSYTTISGGTFTDNWNVSYAVSLLLPHLHCIMFYFGSHKQSFPPGTCVEENSGDDNRSNVHISWVERQFLVAIITTNIMQCLWTTDNALGVTKSLNNRLPNLQLMSETLWPVLACPLEWKTQEDTSYYLTQSPGDLGTLP